MQSLRLKGGGEAAALVTKRFALPERVPFDTSDGNFSIANALRVMTAARGSALERDAGERASERARSRGSRTSRQKSATRASAAETGAISSRAVQAAAVQESSEADAKAGTLSASTPGGSIYLYSITGVLLAEYGRINGVFQPVKDYIYVGNKLLAEYRHAEAKTYFYQQDQINSTRVVTDEAGTVVYSAAHDPYGGIQQTWVNTFDPAPKFSGKERDGESGLDYFGARYYDRAQYRFVSVDPIISRMRMIPNPQLSNHYTFCRNNSINYLDPDGKKDRNIKVVRDIVGKNSTMGRLYIGNTLIGYSLEHPYRDNHRWNNDLSTVSCIPAGTYNVEITVWKDKGKLVLHLLNVENRDGILIHDGIIVAHTHGCILVAKERVMGREKLAGQGLGQSLVYLYLWWKLVDSLHAIIAGQPAEGEVTVTVEYSDATLSELAKEIVNSIRL